MNMSDGRGFGVVNRLDVRVSSSFSGARGQRAKSPVKELQEARTCHAGLWIMATDLA